MKIYRRPIITVASGILLFCIVLLISNFLDLRVRTYVEGLDGNLAFVLKSNGSGDIIHIEISDIPGHEKDIFKFKYVHTDLSYIDLSILRDSAGNITYFMPGSEQFISANVDYKREKMGDSILNRSGNEVYWISSAAFRNSFVIRKWNQEEQNWIKIYPK